MKNPAVRLACTRLTTCSNGFAGHTPTPTHAQRQQVLSHLSILVSWCWSRRRFRICLLISGTSTAVSLAIAASATFSWRPVLPNGCWRGALWCFPFRLLCLRVGWLQRQVRNMDPQNLAQRTDGPGKVRENGQALTLLWLASVAACQVVSPCISQSRCL